MKIAVLPGDGIGPEIVRQAVNVLKSLSRDGLNIMMEEAPIGGAGYDAAQDPLPPKTLALAKASDAVLLGAVGGPKYDTLPRPMRPEQGLLRIRKELGLFANLRPALLYEELANASSLKTEIVAGLDIMILRELTGDIYFGQPRGTRKTDNGEREGFQQVTKFITEVAPWGHPDFEPKLIGKGINAMISPLPRNKRAKHPSDTGDGGPAVPQHSNNGHADEPKEHRPKPQPAPKTEPSAPAFNNPFAQLEEKLKA